jgi:MFS family permease
VIYTMLKIRNLTRIVKPSQNVKSNTWNKVFKQQSVDNFRAFSTTNVDSNESAKKSGVIDRLFGFESNVASSTFNNRWLMVAPAFMTHLCIGAPYAWSLMADTLTRENGFVAAAASDWSLMEAAMPMSIVLAVFGVASSMLGKWQMKVGPRKTMALASLSFGGGMLMAAGGVYLHSLPLLYLGYGGLGGLGLALSYTPPVQTLMQWFPDKKGIASGLTIAGFGSGAFLFAPAAQSIMKKFATLPDYLGPASEFVTKTMDGKLFAEINGSLVEVVQAGASELAKVSFTGLSEGLYVVGTGSTGAAETLAVMSAGYFAVMLASSLSIYKPHPSVNPVPQSSVSTSAVVAPVTAIVPEIDGDEAFKTKQFHLLGMTFFCVATGGLGMFSVAKPMMGEVFSSVLPALVTSAFAAKFVLLLSAGNLGQLNRIKCHEID